MAARVPGDVTLPGALLVYSTPWLAMFAGGALALGLGRHWWRWLGFIPLCWGIAGGAGSWRSRAGVEAPDGRRAAGRDPG